jgi:CheY-like chemotaxis protein
MPRDILIVDDNQGILELLGELIKCRFGIEPFSCSNSTDALEIVRSNKVKALILDYQLGPKDLSGVEVLKIVRNQLRLSVPAILLTGLPKEASEALFHAGIANLGAVSFYGKPIEPATFFSALSDALQSFEAALGIQPAITVDRILARKKALLKPNAETSLCLAYVGSILDDIVLKPDWQTVFVAQKNVRTVQEVQIRRRVTASFECAVSESILTSLGLTAKALFSEVNLGLKASLAKKLTQGFEQQYDLISKHTIEVTELPRGSKVESREYQIAPVYKRIICVLRLDCNCCQVPRNFDFSLDLPTDRIALRQIEHYPEGEPRTILTGYLTGSILPLRTAA